jgi:DNA-3-methyladenine glycosylase I
MTDYKGIFTAIENSLYRNYSDEQFFKRLGLVYDDSELINAVRIGQEFAAATGHAIRYIDIVLVSCGQMEIGSGNTGICLEKNPKCRLCEAQVFCLYKAKIST